MTLNQYWFCVDLTLCVRKVENDDARKNVAYCYSCIYLYDSLKKSKKKQLENALSNKMAFTLTEVNPRAAATKHRVKSC